MKNILALAFVTVLSVSAFAVDPTVDIHFASEALKSIDMFKLSETDQMKVNWVLERLNFAQDNLQKGYREMQASKAEIFANCVTQLDKRTGMTANDASTYCEQNSSQAFIDCTIKLDSSTGMTANDAANACLRHM